MTRLYAVGRIAHVGDKEAGTQKSLVTAAAVHRVIGRNGRWRRAAAVIVFAIVCGALGALCGALIEVGVWRLFARVG